MASQDTPGAPAQDADRIPWRMQVMLAVAGVLAIVAAIACFTGLAPYVRQHVVHSPISDAPTGGPESQPTFAGSSESSQSQPTFAGNSESLQQTVIVPTLDSPCPPCKNIIWCSSFQLAWNELRDNVFHAPLEVTGAEEVVARLNAARQSASDLEASSYYAAAGRMSEGITGRIHKEMAAKFPSHQLPKFPDLADGILAYSYLTAHVPFRHPFRQIRGEFTFTDSQGATTPVAGFGLWQAFLPEYKEIRAQMEILYCREPEEDDERSAIRECAIDLCRYSQPYQVVVAMVPPGGSLADALAHIRQQVSVFKELRYYEQARQFDGADFLRLPEMFWRTDHRFRELVGKTVANAGLPILEAMQTIEFRLDRCGALLESEARGTIGAIPRLFIFNRPFLVYMQKRGAEQPFFVMWVDNAELLTRQ